MKKILALFIGIILLAVFYNKKEFLKDFKFPSHEVESEISPKAIHESSPQVSSENKEVSSKGLNFQTLVDYTNLISALYELKISIIENKNPEEKLSDLIKKFSFPKPISEILENIHAELNKNPKENNSILSLGKFMEIKKIHYNKNKVLSELDRLIIYIRSKDFINLLLE